MSTKKIRKHRGYTQHSRIAQQIDPELSKFLQKVIDIYNSKQKEQDRTVTYKLQSYECNYFKEGV